MTPDLRRKDSKLTRFSLDRRVTVFVLLTTAIVVGTVAATSIPVELFPSGYTAPSLRVSVPWRDSPPREVLDKITEPLEDELSTVKGLSSIRSWSSTGSATVRMNFKHGTDMDIAYREVQDRIERARRVFPDDVDRVYTMKHDTSDIPVYAMGVAVDEEVTDIYNLVQKQIVLPLERVDGVASVEVNGLEEKEIIIELDRDRTEASGLNIYDMAQELGSDSFTMASGHVREGNKKLLLRSVARYHNVDELRNRPVGPNIRLKDIANVTYDEPEKRYRVRAMSKPAYAVIVYKEGQANAQEVCERIRKVYDQYEHNPRLGETETVVFFDQGEMIEESITTLLQSGAIGAIIACFVLFFFLRRFRLTMVVNLAVPLSLLIALTAMFFAGETINILTMLALMICVGLLVDNSVVVAENIDRMHKAGMTRRDAAIRGAGEIALAIVMSTLTTVVVFLPVALLEGPAQFFLLRMSIPISVALIASLLVALVYIPLGVYLSLPPREDRDRLARPAVARMKRILGRAYDVSFGKLNHTYNGVLGLFLRRRLDMVLGLLVVFALTMGVAKARDIGFSDVDDDEDAGFEIDVELPQTYTLEETEAWFLKAEKIVEDHADEFDLEGWFLFHGKTFGELQGWFKTPRTNRLTQRDVTERLLAIIPQPPGIELTTGDEEDEDVGGDEAMFATSLQGQDPDLLDAAAESLEKLLLNVPGVLGIRRDQAQQPNEMALVVDRDRVQRYNVNPQVVAGVVGYALRGQNLPKYRDEGREVPVRVRYQEKDRDNLQALSSFWVPTESGNFVPLSSLVDVEFHESPSYIYRRDKQMIKSITLDLKEGQEKEAKQHLNFIMAGLDLPEGIAVYRPIRTNTDEDQEALIFGLLLSILFIYLLMGLLFESFILPLSIILTIPLAILGVLWVHIVAGINIDFLGGVGVVLLVGVVVNNGIVLIDYVNRLRADGMDRRKAILMSTDRRFRPIMMTAITTVGGMIPLAIAGRMDSGISYTSFALTLIGGMTTATLLTLLVVPVFYTFFDDLRVAFEGALKRGLKGRSRDAGTPQGVSGGVD